MARTEGPAEVPIRREGVHHGVGVTGGHRGLVAADHITGAGGPGLKYRRPDVTPLVDRPLAAVGPEHHRQVVGGFGDHRDRPRQLPPVVVQAGQQFYYGPPAGIRGSQGLGTGVEPGQPGQVVADEPPHLLVAADLASLGVIDHHLPWPHGLQSAAITFVKRGEVLRDRISLTCGASLPARQLHGTGEFGKPRHLDSHDPWPTLATLVNQVHC
jgi:hypothetical protein